MRSLLVGTVLFFIPLLLCVFVGLVEVCWFIFFRFSFLGLGTVE